MLDYTLDYFCFVLIFFKFTYFGGIQILAQPGLGRTLASALLHRLFSSCGEGRLLSSYNVRASRSGGFSCCCRAQALWCVGCSSICSWALEHRLSSYGACLSYSDICGIFLDQRSNPGPKILKMILFAKQK